MAPNSVIETFIGTYFVVMVILAVIWIIANWKIYTKADTAGWKSLIPVYNMYTLYKITWKTSMFWIMLACEIVASIINYFAGNSTALIAIAGIVAVVGGIIGIIQLHKESVSFGHGIGFTLGLIILNPIFVLILAFGSSKYVGAQK